MLKFLSIKFLIILLISGLLFFLILQKNEIKKVQIGDIIFNAEIARTPKEKAKGLAGHKPLKNNEGMLFVFNKNEGSTFWMKGMTFSLDIIWIKNNKVFYLVENAQPPYAGMKDNELPVFTPPEGADYVLEVGAGITKKYKIKVGDAFNF